MSVKAGAVEAFTELIESEIIPLVRHLKGFQDALTLIVPGGREAIGISVWSREDADDTAAAREGSHDRWHCSDDFGTAKTFQLSNSTFHKIGTRVSL